MAYFSRVLKPLLLFLGVTSIVACTPEDTQSPLARTRNGTYQGVYSAQFDQDFFLGIPYAQPPVGPLRLRTPQPLDEAFGAVKLATSYSPECIGYGSDDFGYTQSEDCLYLNVIRPAGNFTSSGPLPVAVWIHGGGYEEGGTVDRRYNLSRIVENAAQIGRPMIGVSINYRLSFWGFGYSKEFQQSGNTNLGLRDQRLALHWIQENIRAFGGDAKRVTIWGESAGASSVGFHLVSYGGRDDGLFRASIMESGNPVPYQNLNGTSYFQPLYDQIAQSTGCSKAADSLSCLRRLSFSSLNAAVNTSSNGDWFPVLDGDFLSEYPSKQLAEGRFVKVPIISGANTDEGTSFVPTGINTTADLRSFIASTAPNLQTSLIDQLLTAYPDDPCVGIPADLGCQRLGPPYGAEYRRAAADGGDYVFIAPRRQTCATWAAAGLAAYCYRFDARPYNLTRETGVTHFQEVAFVFNNTAGDGYTVDPFAHRPPSFFKLASLISRSWAGFVTDLDPNKWREDSNDLPVWPAYNFGSPQDYVFRAPGLSYVENDTYRADGMKIINDNAAAWLR